MMIIFKPLGIQFLWFWQCNYSTRQRCIDSWRYCISSCVEWLYVKSCWYSRNAIVFSVWISFNWNHLNEILILILSHTSKKELKKNNWFSVRCSFWQAALLLKKNTFQEIRYSMFEIVWKCFSGCDIMLV